MTQRDDKITGANITRRLAAILNALILPKAADPPIRNFQYSVYLFVTTRRC
ncbi:uncharacterized protein METZ01_LOCUS31930 [marine metagenome]|uniref:Uncharacterized protein n=1 Tax=marine metagenome TaxID=408172 RepID=A0A381QID4_9ZZZZ|tara:strand:- start:465 stop:617 length:153 start_codon:yes stop_codon:yes gene_type:complete